VNLQMTAIDQVTISGDRDRLKQVFLNLLGNAVQYTPAGGAVNLSLDRVGEKVRVIISDTGPGIPAQDLPHIFERFYRGEKSRTRSGSTGFGLGLSIAYWIVRNHGGSIDVNSRDGQGTTFCVWLPITPPQPE
jgi:two-component system OmpR family sensor kinase